MADEDTAGTKKQRARESKQEDGFVAELFENLRGDATQSNFMRAYCGAKNASKFDARRLRAWDRQAPARMIRTLLERGEMHEKLAATGSGPAAEAKHLAGLLQRNKEERKDFGVDSLRLGFPLVQLTDDKSGRSLLCPLALWKVKLELVNGKYILSREFTDVVELNDALCRYLSSERDLDLRMGGVYSTKDSINDVDVEILAGVAIPGLSRDQAAEQLAAALGRGLDAVPDGPPSGAKERVIWGAVLGMFKSSNATILRDLDLYRQRGQLALSSEPILDPASGLLFSGLPLDPSQFEAVRQLALNKNLVINGPPGTGKSQTLAGLLSCAGANGLKTLVVCEKTTPLLILQRKLNELRWGAWTGDRFSVLISNVQERDEVIARAHANRNEIEQTEEAVLLAEVRQMTGEVERLRREIAVEEDKFRRHKEINDQLVSFNLTVKEAIAFVIGHKLEGRTVLRLPAKLDLSKTVFAEDHLMMLNRCEENLSRDTVQALRKLKLTELSLPFDPDALIVAAGQLKQSVEQVLAERQAVLEKARNAILAKQEAHVELWENQHAELQALKEQVSDVPREQVQAFDSPTWLDAALSFWNTSKAKLRYLKSALDKVREELVRLDAPAIPVNFTLSNIDLIFKWSAKHRSKALEAARKLREMSDEAAWAHYKAEVPEASRAELEACNARVRAAVSASPFSSAPAQERFSALLDEFLGNKECIWQLEKELLPFSRDSLPSWRQASDSLTCMAEFGLLQNEAFFLEFLDSGDPLSWGDRLKLAILSQEVESKCKDLLASDFVLDKLSDSLAHIQRHVKSLFCAQHALRMRGAIHTYESRSRQKFEQYYNRAAKNSRVNSLREIVKDLDLFTACFPVIFCTPETASTLFKGRYRYFDLVVVDEASQSLTHDAYAALLKGRKVVIAGDNKQMPPTTLFSGGSGAGHAAAEFFDALDDLDDLDDMHSLAPAPSGAAGGAAGADGDVVMAAPDASVAHVARNAANAESLLDFATDHSFEFRSVDLLFHYRSLDPALMRFHCAAVYPNLALCPEQAAGPAPEDGMAIELTQVNGVYRDQSNKREAAAVVELLRSIVPQAAQRGRSVAVATFNDVQKKLIYKLIKDCADPDFAREVRALQSQQLFFVKNLENLQGDEVDVLVVSTTFGPSAAGVFAQRFGRINFTGLGYRYLNVLFSRAKRKIHLVTSIPEREYVSPARILDDAGTLSGPSMLYGFLSYAKAISTGDSARVASVLREYRAQADSQAQGPTRANSLEQVICDHLRRRTVDSSKIRIVDDGDARTLLRGILVQLDNHRSLVIECNTYESYRQTIHRRAILNQFSYEYYQVWPANWLFDNPRREFEKLRKAIADIRRKKVRPHSVVAPLAPVQPRATISALDDSEYAEATSTGALQSTPLQLAVTAAAPHLELLADEAQASSALELDAPSNDVSPGSSRSESPSPVTELSAREIKAMISKPFLVKYGQKRRFIVFRPEKSTPGNLQELVGKLGGRRIRIAASRCQKLRGDIPREMFLDEVEHKMALHYLSEIGAEGSTQADVAPASEPKPSNAARRGRALSELEQTTDETKTPAAKPARGEPAKSARPAPAPARRGRRKRTKLNLDSDFEEMDDAEDDPDFHTGESDAGAAGQVGGDDDEDEPYSSRSRRRRIRR